MKANRLFRWLSSTFRRRPQNPAPTAQPEALSGEVLHGRHEDLTPLPLEAGPATTPIPIDKEPALNWSDTPSAWMLEIAHLLEIERRKAATLLADDLRRRSIERLYGGLGTGSFHRHYPSFGMAIQQIPGVPVPTSGPLGMVQPVQPRRPELNSRQHLALVWLLGMVEAARPVTNTEDEARIGHLYAQATSRGLHTERIPLGELLELIHAAGTRALELRVVDSPFNSRTICYITVSGTPPISWPGPLLTLLTSDKFRYQGVVNDDESLGELPYGEEEGDEES